MMGRVLVLFLALMCVGCAQVANTVFPVATAGDSVGGGAYDLDVHHAGVVFSIRHMGLAQFYGRIAATGGALTLDPDTPESAHLSVILDAASISTANAELDAKLRDLLETDRYPEMRFESTKVIRTGEAEATVEGLLTIRDVTAPVNLAVTFAGRRTDPMLLRERLGFNATGQITLSAFKLSSSWTGFVSDDITLMIGAEFVAP